MARRHYNPLACIPSPEIIRDKLQETLTQAERLRLLLDLSERLQLSSGSPPDTLASSTNDWEEVSHG